MAWWKYTLVGVGTVAGLGASWTVGFVMGRSKGRDEGYNFGKQDTDRDGHFTRSRKSSPGAQPEAQA